jgi:hypothetical protein
MDYAALPTGALTFAPGETRKSVNVAVRGDAIGEPDETFGVTLSQAQGADIADGDALGTIVNDDVDIGPVVSSLVLTNDVGAPIDGPVVALYGVPVDLQAAFSSAAPLDTHTAIIDWGDGSSGPGVVDESAGNGTVRASHAWAAPGFYTVRVSVTDDDATTASRQITINVKDGASAVCQASWFELSMMTDGSVDAQTWYDARRMLGQLWGEIDDRPGAGACNLIVQGDGMGALVAIGDAVGMIEALIAGGQLDASQIGELRRLVRDAADAGGEMALCPGRARDLGPAEAGRRRRPGRSSGSGARRAGLRGRNRSLDPGRAPPDGHVMTRI